MCIVIQEMAFSEIFCTSVSMYVSYRELTDNIKIRKKQ